MKSPIAIIGGLEEEKTGKKVELESENNQIINFAGVTNIFQSAYIIKESRLVISMDTGMQHIAAALQKKIMAIWGSTTPELQMEPYLPRNIDTQFKHVNFVVPNLKCQPCSAHGLNDCPEKHFNCMNLQPIEKIADQANHFFDILT